ncbi:MAG: hypothetical protein GF383_10850 [Candidatus Lokiarchaeota archaeon]|nr:hypothetical protein [Candidatus Lokiarchaeota archaeon]MBD3341102.1 hypothetical protein [Candidatus Lokiarchaeota archaeon]
MNKRIITNELSSLKVSELKDICRNNEISGYSSLKKSEVINLIATSLEEDHLKNIFKEYGIIPEEVISDKEIKKTIETGRELDERTYLNYLLQSLTKDELKEICRSFNIKGYSRFKKGELIEYILDSLAEEEYRRLLYDKEIEIISEGIRIAIDKIQGKDRESIKSIKIVNKDKHDVEIVFSGMNWEIVSFLSIREQNINNPMRDCDCRIGGNMGFCSHFWVGFIFSLKQGFFNRADWTLTRLPENFEELIQTIKIDETGAPASETSEENFSIVDKSTEDFQLAAYNGKAITVYEGIIDAIEKKEQEFQGVITVYYLLDLKDVKLGLRVKKKSEFREEDLIDLDLLNVRLSERLFEDNNLKRGNKLKFNGRLDRDDFLKMYIIKNIRKITVLNE